MEVYDSLEDQIIEQAELKYSLNLTILGVQYVMMDGMIIMLKLSADS